MLWISSIIQVLLNPEDFDSSLLLLLLLLLIWWWWLICVKVYFTQCLLLVLKSEMTPGRLGWSYRIPGIQHRLTACKANTWPTALLFLPLIYFLFLPFIGLFIFYHFTGICIYTLNLDMLPVGNRWINLPGPFSFAFLYRN